MITVHIDKDLEELIPGFLANRQRDTGKIDDALASGDFDAIRMIAHSMKGSGGGYGFQPITDFGAQMEQAAVARDSATIAEANRALREYLQQVNVEYR